MKRVVIYCRVSRSTDESVSIDRQEAELRAMAHAEGWPIAAVLIDDGFSGRKDRENADAALGMLADGDAEVLLVWEMSRWSRMGLVALARLVDILQSRKGLLFITKKEGLRSDQPSFELLASVIAVIARYEAEGTRDRILSMRRHVLAQTDPAEQRWLGGQPPFGYRAIDRPSGPGRTLVIDDFEAGFAREGSRRLAAGDRLTDVTRWLQDSGVATPQSAARRARQAGQAVHGLDGGLWRVTTVRKLFLSPTLLGRTTRKVQVATRADGTPVWDYTAVTDDQGIPITRWEPVVDPGTLAAVQAMVTARGSNPPKKAASWLSGYLYCGLCGSVLYANTRKDRTAGSFRCANKVIPGAACRGVSISRERVEEHMEGVILGMIGGLQEFRVTERVEGAADSGELDGVAQAIADVQSAMALDGADYPALVARMKELTSRRRQLLDAPGKTVRTREATGRLLADAWREGSVQEKQFILGDMLDSVTVRKATSTRGAIADRLDEVWMDQVTEADYL